MKPARPLVAAFAGALLPLSMAPFDIWLLGLVSVGIWFWLLMDSPGRGLLLGWCYGLGKYGLGVSWVYVSIHDHGNASPLLAAVLVALFVGGMALFPMLNGWLFRRLLASKVASKVSKRMAGDWMRAGLCFVVLLVGFEWLLTWFLTGFPWLMLGYGHLTSPLAGFAPLGGVMLVSLMAALVAVALVLQLRQLRSAGRQGISPLLLAIMGLPWLLGGALSQVQWTQPATQQTVALVQGNVAQSDKWQPENRLPIIQKYRALSEPHWGADLILWPEAAITVFEHQAQELLQLLDERAQSSGSALILGIPAVIAYPNEEYAFLNTAIGLGMADGRYVKRRLVPFGEYVPLEGLLRGLIDFFDLPMSHAESGAWRQPGLSIGASRAVMAICYEVVYPELVREQADVLLTISNDTWFGRSIGPLQHLGIARMRALENGRWLLRGTNNGVTAIVGPDGRVRDRLPQFEAAVLTGEYWIMTGRTPFNRFGQWPVFTIVLVIGAGLLLRVGLK